VTAGWLQPPARGSVYPAPRHEPPPSRRIVYEIYMAGSRPGLRSSRAVVTQKKPFGSGFRMLSPEELDPESE
jgi:hypothetical protein